MVDGNGKWRSRIVERRTIRVGDLAVNKYNPKTHPAQQQTRLNAVLDKFGIVEDLLVYHSERNGGALTLFDGHARQNLDDSQEWGIAITDLTDAEVDELVFYFDPLAGMSLHDEAKMTALMQDLGDVDGALGEMLAELAEGVGLAMPEMDLLGVPKDAKPNPRQLPIDVIYTFNRADSTCCLAVQAGLKYGIQSKQYRICPYTGQLSGRHKVEFIDNDYFDYDHATHLKAVKELLPKYATVRDIMSKEQCKEADIAWYSLEQILDWAEELSRYAEQVIVIPKYDCLDRIPDKYVLGYSVPTSHGGTPLPVAMFKGRRVHLLGGSWRAQLAHMAELGDSVVSLDNNYVHRQASMLGIACDPDGREFKMQDVGYGYVTNVRYVALALSFGAMGAKVNELYAGADNPA